MIIILVFKLKENLQALPQSLDQLVAYSLKRLCSQYRHLIGLRWALAALTVSACGENFNAKMECKKVERKLTRNQIVQKHQLCKSSNLQPVWCVYMLSPPV